MNSQNPNWYSSLKSISISSSYIHTGLLKDPFLIFQSIICLNSPSFPCMPHSLPILSQFFNSLLPDKHYKLSNSTLCILLLPFPLSSSQTWFSSFCSQTKQLINVKKHSPILQALFYVIHSMHFLTIHILINKMVQFKSNKSNHKPHFIFHTNFYVSAPRWHLHSVH